jgi:hypothetical protein
METRAPACAKARAQLRPMPRLPPATTTLLPEKSMILSFVGKCRGYQRRAACLCRGWPIVEICCHFAAKGAARLKRD